MTVAGRRVQVVGLGLVGASIGSGLRARGWRVTGSDRDEARALRARELLASDWGVSAEAWSVTNYKALREEALTVERYNRLHPSEPRKIPYVTRMLNNAPGPVVAVTDHDGVGPVTGSHSETAVAAGDGGRAVASPDAPVTDEGSGDAGTRCGDHVLAV